MKSWTMSNKVIINNLYPKSKNHDMIKQSKLSFVFGTFLIFHFPMIFNLSFQIDIEITSIFFHPEHNILH